MSIQKTEARPNIYKLQKFVVINAQDSYSNKSVWDDGSGNKVATLRPNVLICYKVYITFNSQGSKIELVDTNVEYKVHVPHGILQVDNANANSSNSLICPPYISSDQFSIAENESNTLSEHVAGNRIHPLSIIFAQRRDFNLSLTSTEGSFIDINSAGRTLKVSSSTGKSNGVSLADVDYTQAHQNSKVLDTRYPQGTIGSNGIKRVLEACMVNEDSNISYLSDIDNVNADGGTWTASETLYALKVTAVSDGNATIQLNTFSTDGSPATKFDQLTDFDGSSDNTQKLNHASSETTHDGQLVTVKYNIPPLVDSPNRRLELSYLTNRNIAPSANLLTKASSPETAAINIGARASHFIVTNQQPDSGVKSALEGLELHEMMSNANDHGIYNHNGSIEKFYEGNHDKTFFLTVETDGGTNTPESATKTYFKKFTHLDQLRGVNFYNTSDSSSPVALDKSMLMYPKVFGTGSTHGVTFRPAKQNPALTLDGLKEGGYKLYKENNGIVELVDFPAEDIDSRIGNGNGQVGDGTVRYLNESKTLQLKDVDFGANSDGAHDSLNYQPKLFGICKEDGSYEYRYFLTSAAVTAT
jgi:hypothetical protein